MDGGVHTETGDMGMTRAHNIKEPHQENLVAVGDQRIIQLQTIVTNMINLHNIQMRIHFVTCLLCHPSIHIGSFLIKKEGTIM